MTSLVSWIGVDNRKISSLYIASDSRLTRPREVVVDGVRQKVFDVVSDSAQKVFACATCPDIFGYCGNAEEPPRALASLVEAVDRGTIPLDRESAYTRAEQIRDYIRTSLPITVGGPDYSETLIVHGTRQGEGYLNADFVASEIFVHGSRWTRSTQQLPDCSDIVVARGSGASYVTQWRERWVSAQRARTSRGVFGALCKALEVNDDSKSGGAPQLVGIYQEGLACTFGIIYKNERYVAGARVPAEDAALWHDDLFQRCDGQSMKPLLRAARHKKPKGL